MSPRGLEILADAIREMLLVIDNEYACARPAHAALVPGQVTVSFAP